MIFDTHAHYDDEQFDPDREELLAALPARGIGAVVDVGASPDSCRKAVELAGRYGYIYAAVGVHPDSVKELDEEKINWIRETARREKKVVAIGEIGLDYYWDTCDREVQKYWFRRQIGLAKEVRLPVIIHSREAARDTFDILKEENAAECGGVIHCYSGSLEMAREYVKMGFYLGIGGVLTFKSAKTLKAVAEGIALEHLVLETDCPYLAPVPYRGRRNCSEYLTEVVREMSRIKEIPEEEILRVTWENAKKLYRLEGIQ